LRPQYFFGSHKILHSDHVFAAFLLETPQPRVVESELLLLKVGIKKKTLDLG